MNSPFLVAIINLFFVPLIPVFFYHKKKDRPLAFGTEFLCHYGMTAAFLIPIAKAIALLPVKMFHRHVDLDSGYYTVAALIAAWLLPFLADIFQHISIEAEFVKTRNEAPSDEEVPE